MARTLASVGAVDIGMAPWASKKCRGGTGAAPDIGADQYPTLCRKSCMRHATIWMMYAPSRIKPKFTHDRSA
jgi:hypothetical protein